MEPSPIVEVNASSVSQLTTATPLPHPNQIREMLLRMDGKKTKDGSVIYVSKGAWEALEKYNQRFLKTMPKK